jgi:hypothetical protein
MGSAKIWEIALGLDNWFHSLNDKLNPTREQGKWLYGRGLEQASGMGFLFIAITMAYGGGFGFSSETIAINNFLWAWMAIVLGFCQLYYNGLTQRRVYNLMATSGWITLAMGAYIELQGWNLITAISLPYTLCSFYVYGFLCGETHNYDN